MAYYPVTKEEVAMGPHRGGEYPTCTIPVREDITMNDGRSIVLLSWGSPLCYEVVEHNGHLYGVGSVLEGWPKPVFA